ncbi:7TM diverse intracellular signaling domain-containing protein [Cytophagales bacterium LB-30]|uniref:7TM diverse intracellular signaling domain-containing protein n=1 Tax=Shiella aurantiaca TaxID=3058365 RepID=A0ABT8F8D4_9BACT|nr:7TM diverse intracellular signaling domain-containing protein [Shiella aurantiaca]MDN4166639.1 7TM diverse intracellular signaling domain-containing protein [Shiella aurantiaca]
MRLTPLSLLLWLFLGFVLIGSSSHAQNAWELGENKESIITLEDIEYLVDTSNQLSFADIVQHPEYFAFHKDKGNKDFAAGAAYWIRLPITHTSSGEALGLLEFYDQTIDHLEAYLPQKDGSYKHLITGDTHPFKERIFRHKNFEFLLEDHPDSTYWYYFKVVSHDFADIRIAFRSVDRFVYYALNEYYLFGMFYGMIIIISLYNFLVYLAIKEIKHIYYILYILSVALYAMCIDGIAFQYLWPNLPELNRYMTGVALFSVILWALIFTQRFLNTRANAPKLHKILSLTILLRSALFLFCLLFYPNWFSYRNIEIIPLSVIFYAGITVWLNGYHPARFFVMAYGLLFIGFLLRGLVFLEVLPFTIMSHYSLHLSFVIEMLFLTFALGDRIRILKANRDKAMMRIVRQHELNVKLKDKVNRELEMKVKERTMDLEKKKAELEQLNQKLGEQAREINQINSMLDLENWKLKNNIKEVLTDRLLDKTLSYEEFRTLYPNTLACQRFLEELKWSKGFLCHKCANDKFFEGNGKFDRRCTKCGYNESITAFTLFQGIKFPLEKAFYIAYTVISYRKGFTLEEIATKLDMRINTVWNFRKKILEKIEAHESRGNKVSTAKWQQIILMPPHKSVKRKKAVPSPNSSPQ